MSHPSDTSVRVYIEATLTADRAIAAVRDELYARMGVDSHYRKSQPHLTIIPPFTVDAETVHTIRQLVSATSLPDTQIPLAGVGLWQSVKNPRVVLLDTPVDLTATRTQLLTQLRELGAAQITAPVSPHITLFKTDNGYAVPPAMKTQIQQTICATRDMTLPTTQLNYVDVVVIDE